MSESSNNLQTEGVRTKFLYIHDQLYYRSHPIYSKANIRRKRLYIVALCLCTAIFINEGDMRTKKFTLSPRSVDLRTFYRCLFGTSISIGLQTPNLFHLLTQIRYAYAPTSSFEIRKDGMIRAHLYQMWEAQH